MTEFDWKALDQSPAASAQMIQWHAPRTYQAICEALISEAWTEKTERRDKRRADLEARGVVYYIELRPGVVKIGYTGQLQQRLASFRVSHTALLATEPGGRDVERERHLQFAQARLHPRREDFELVQEIQEHIDELRSLHPLPRWATLPDTTVVTRK